MSCLSIALCSRQFWPHVGPTSWWNTDFCRGMNRQGHKTTVFTQRANDQNPVVFDWNGSKVIRTFINPWNPFAIAPSFLNSSRHLRQALSLYSQKLDGLVINDSLRESIVAIQFAVRNQLPAIVRVDQDWTAKSNWGRAVRQIKKILRRMKSPIQFVANDAETAKNLDELPNIEFIEDGIDVSDFEFESSLSREQRRISFSETHPILELKPTTPMALFVGPIPEETQLVEFVQAWSQVRRELPEARFWISGSGAGESEIWQAIVQRELNNEVLMVGQFESLNDLIQIADVFVVPTIQPAQLALVRRYVGFAISRGLRVFCIDSSLNERLGLNQSNRLAGGDESASLAIRLKNYLKADTSEPAKNTMQLERVIDFRETVRAYEDLLSRIVNPSNG